MPAPSRRNVGASLHEQIGDHAAPRSIENRRDRIVSARTRNAKKFEEAEARLTLAERADQARSDYARARAYEHFEAEVRAGRAKPPVVVLAPQQPPRYTLDCLDCGYVIHLHRPEPRVPLCRFCKDKREARKIERRRG